METSNAPYTPKILVFSTNNISDPGIDLAGSAHFEYPPTVYVITVPCSSGIKPEWILYAVKKGIDGVFIAADGTDCPYLPDCTTKTASIVEKAQELLKSAGYRAERVKMSAICSVCAEPFTNHIRSFIKLLEKLGPPKEVEVS